MKKKFNQRNLKILNSLNDIFSYFWIIINEIYILLF